MQIILTMNTITSLAAMMAMIATSRSPTTIGTTMSHCGMDRGTGAHPVETGGEGKESVTWEGQARSCSYCTLHTYVRIHGMHYRGGGRLKDWFLYRGDLVAEVCHVWWSTLWGG